MDSIGVQLPILSRLVFCVPEEIALWSWKSRLLPASDLSVVTLESNYQFRPRLPRPLPVLASTGVQLPVRSSKYGSDFQPTSHVFQSTEKKNFKAQRIWFPPAADTTSWHTTT